MATFTVQKGWSHRTCFKCIWYLHEGTWWVRGKNGFPADDILTNHPHSWLHRYESPPPTHGPPLATLNTVMKHYHLITTVILVLESHDATCSIWRKYWCRRFCSSICKGWCLFLWHLGIKQLKLQTHLHQTWTKMKSVSHRLNGMDTGQEE